MTIKPKTILIGVIVIAVIFAGTVLWREGYWSGKYKSDTGTLKTLVSTEQTNRRAAEAQIAVLNAGLKTSETQRAADKTKSDKRIADLVAVNVTLSQQNDVYKKNLTGMTDDQVVKEFDAWIGKEQITLMAIGRFSLSRLGAEKSLSLFSDGAEAAAKCLNLQSALGECQDAKEKMDLSYKDSIDKWSKKFDLVSGELSDCRNSSQAKDKAISDLSHKIFWKNVEGWTERGVIVFLLAKVIGVL